MTSLSMGCVRTEVAALTRVAATATTSSNPGPAAPAILSVGDRQYALAACRSGDREYFRGVDLADAAAQTRLRLLIDPMDGPRLRVAGGGEERVIVRSCRRLEARVDPTGWRVNRVRDVSGFVDADCTTDSGLEVHAHVQFTHCH
jgi:hypothetical protein